MSFREESQATKNQQQRDGAQNAFPHADEMRKKISAEAFIRLQLNSIITNYQQTVRWGTRRRRKTVLQLKNIIASRLVDFVFVSPSRFYLSSRIVAYIIFNIVLFCSLFHCHGRFRSLSRRCVNRWQFFFTLSRR
jgi:hypothetical protein